MILKRLQRWWYIFALWACRMFCVVFFRMHMIGQENVPGKGSFLLISNHQSMLDPIFCGAPISRQLVYVARDTLYNSFVFRCIISSVGSIPVRRGAADLTAIKRMLSSLKQGYGLCLFPEATRTDDGRIIPMRPGFAMLSRKTNSPIVPVVIDGAYECWPKGTKMFKPWIHITVSYGKPISPEQAAEMGDEKLAAHITDITRHMLNQCRTLRGKNIYNYDDQEQAAENKKK